MAANETSPVAALRPGWARRLPLDEKVFLWLVAASVTLMTAFAAAWVFLADQNVPTAYRPTTPEAFAAQVNEFAKRYQGPDGRVVVPPGTDAYLMAYRYGWTPELVLQEDTEYRIWISSADNLHGFSIVGGTQNLNLEISPNHASGVSLTPDAPGRYLVVCNEYCGLGHHKMMGYITVQSPVAFRETLAGAGAGAADPTEPAAAAGAALKLVADPNNALAFDTKTLEAKAGEVTITMDNPAFIPHNVAIKGSGVDVKGPEVGEGGVSTVKATLEPGTYVFYCSVPGHEAGGMKGTLTVKP